VQPEELVAVLGASPGRAAVFVDFDGTMAPIVPSPPDARPVPAAVAALVELAARCPVVAVVSGRPVAFLDPFFPAAIRLAGLYGLEQRVEGRRAEHARAEGWRPVVSCAVIAATRDLPDDVLVEDKGLSLTLHYRLNPGRADEVAAWASRRAGEAGLEARPAKMSVELHPPVHVDKGDLVVEWSAGLDTVVFAGDDAGDLAAFAALARLRRDGLTTCGIAVASAETPRAVLDAADLNLEGPAALAELLVRLAEATAPRT
jgi:trehalose 6-phosphate phosphatase